MLSGYSLSFPVELRFRDLDALGHVNNVVYLTYMESARLAWWMKVTGLEDLAGLDMILARTEIDYRSPASFGDRLVVGVRCATLSRSSFTLEFSLELMAAPGSCGSGRLSMNADIAPLTPARVAARSGGGRGHDPGDAIEPDTGH